MKKIIICSICSSIISGTILGIIGYSIAKKRYQIHKLSGQIFVDYSEDNNHPNIYLVGVDPDIFKNIRGYAILKVDHYNRK